MDKGGVRSTRATPARSAEESAADTALPTAINKAASHGRIRLEIECLVIWLLVPVAVDLVKPLRRAAVLGCRPRPQQLTTRRHWNFPTTAPVLERSDVSTGMLSEKS